MLTLDLYTAFDCTIRFVAVGVCLSTLELITIRQQFGTKGVFSVDTVAPFYGRSNRLVAIDRWLSPIFITQLTAAIALVLSGPFSLMGSMMLLIVLLTLSTIRWRRHTGGDGAEQMTMIVFAASALALFPYPSPERINLVALFLVAQVSLSYITAGIAKLISPVWRNGTALPAILSTYSHGHAGAASFLQRHPVVVHVASWGVIVFECLFPLLLFGPPWLLLTTLLLGFAFHLCCAFLMGLNSFLWSFPALYPCIIVIVQSYPLSLS